MNSLEFVIVQDMFLDGSRPCGSLFFPVASSFERDRTFIKSERRIQRVRKAIESTDKQKADWEIICELARAMGKGEFFIFIRGRNLGKGRTVWRAGRGITYTGLEEGGLRSPCQTEDHPGTTVLRAKSFPRGWRAPLQQIGFTASNEPDFV